MAVKRPKINLTPQFLDLALYGGDGAEFNLTVRDSNKAPVPLTGAMRAQIRITRDAPDPPLASFGVDLSGSASGLVTLSLTSADTQALVPTEEKFVGAWDLEWTPTGKEPRTIIQGKVECWPDVSR
jgi:hypothetical protein